MTRPLTTDSITPATPSLNPASVPVTTKNDAVVVAAAAPMTAAMPRTISGRKSTCPNPAGRGVVAATAARSRGSVTAPSSGISTAPAKAQRQPTVRPMVGTASPPSNAAKGMALIWMPKARPCCETGTSLATRTLVAGPETISPTLPKSMMTSRAAKPLASVATASRHTALTAFERSSERRGPSGRQRAGVQ